jgi:hypothetical protein
VGKYFVAEAQAGLKFEVLKAMDFGSNHNSS